MKLLNFIRNKLIRKFINLRFLSAQQISYDEIIRIELLVAMCLLTIVSSTLYIIIGLFVGVSLSIIINYAVFFTTVVPLVLYLIKKGYYNQAKLFMMIIGSFFMFIKAASLGRESGMNLAMLIIVFATFAFYSINDYKYIILSLVLTTGLIVILEISDYSLFGLDSATSSFEYEFNYLFTGLFCILFFYVILRVNQYMNTKLIVLNTKLRLKNITLKKLNEELDSYVYRTSHDMRAPLTSLMGLIHLIKTEKEIHKIEDLTRMQENCVNKLDAHIQQIIHLSKNIRTHAQLEFIDFGLILNNIFEELSFFEHSTNVHKIIRITSVSKFYSDAYRIKTILNNLISNSFKYYRISNVRPIIEIDISINDRFTTILIKDNGIGIPEESIKNIFDMFYRASNQSKGSGLGLYIVKEMVEKLNGTISVKSKVDLFTQFIINLPNRY